MTQYHVPVIIVGAGISGLWLLNVLEKKGIKALLLEKNDIGQGQTIWAQGIIHSGVKYQLNTKHHPAAQAVAAAAQTWEACLQGQGLLDLSKVPVLSEHHDLCFLPHPFNFIQNFFSQRLLKSQSNRLKKAELPDFFKHQSFKGSLLRISEKVLDVPTLIKTLSEPHASRIWKIDERTHFHYGPDHHLESIELQGPEGPITLKAQQYIFTAGAGNAELLPKADTVPHLQLRPLHMVWVIFPRRMPEYEVFMHVVKPYQSVPEITFTSHQTQEGKTVWYLGGNLAETGLERSASAQIEIAKKLLTTTFPWIDFQGTHWDSGFISRAEQANGGKRPDHFGIKTFKNIQVCWPTKLTLAPVMIESLCAQLPLAELQTASLACERLPGWPSPKLAKPLWEQS